MARILFVSHMSDLGGPPYSLLRLLKYISKQHDVAVAAPGSGQLFEALEQMAIPSYQAGPHGLTRRSIPWLSRLILRQRFDLVYGNSYSSGSRNALIAAKLTGRPFIWHIREIIKDETNRRMSYALRWADLIIAVSQASAQSVKFRVPRKPVHVVYNGIELDEFCLDRTRARRHVRSILGIPQDYTVIANIGLVCAWKGQAYGVQAASKALSGYPAAAFAFLGRLNREPAYANRLLAYIAERKLEDRIQFLGFRSDVPGFLGGCDIFLHTAAWDPNPLVILEAMGAGLPVVAFLVDGVKEQVVDGETGYLVPLGDVDALAAALGECLENPSVRMRMGERGRKRVESMFTARETARKIGALVNDLLAAKSKSRFDG
jgi:glycosyltransferase involved in cell wall biosynthesis